MGMFDRIMVPCPACSSLEEFQSKGGACALATYTLHNAPDDAMSDVNRHSPHTCTGCGLSFYVGILGERYAAIPMDKSSIPTMREAVICKVRQELISGCNRILARYGISELLKIHLEKSADLMVDAIKTLHIGPLDEPEVDEREMIKLRKRERMEIFQKLMLSEPNPDHPKGGEAPDAEPGQSAT